MKYKLGVGVLFLLAGFAMYWSQAGMVLAFSPPQSQVSAGEFNLWLTNFTFWLPAAVLIGLSVPPTGQLFLRLSLLSQSKPRIAILGVITLLAIAYRAGRYFFLRDLPVTDEEYTNQFGGRLLASGRWAVDLAIPKEQMPTLFLINTKDGWASFDFLGIQIVWAFSELTQTGPWIFAILAAGTVVGIYFLLRELVDHRWGLIGAVIYILSPMATILSLTTHAHIVSRLFIVWFLYWWVRADSEGRTKFWGLCGFCWGAAMTCRPAETLTLSAPFLLFSAFQVLKRSESLGSTAAFLAGVIPFVFLYFFHNHGVTGNIWVPPRMAPNDLTTPHGNLNALTTLSEFDIVRFRFVENVLNNIRYTFLYWHGAVGVVLVGFGVVRKRTETLFVAGLVLNVSIGLLHDDLGIRAVGPIHCSEWVVFLTVLATLGLKRIHAMRPDATQAILVTIALTGVLTAGVMGNSLRLSNGWHEEFFDFVETNVPKHSVVMAPRNWYFWRTLPLGTFSGSWVFETRSPTPNLEDDVIILRYTTGAEAWARKRFPERQLFLLKPAAEAPYMTINAE